MPAVNADNQGAKQNEAKKMSGTDITSGNTVSFALDPVSQVTTVGAAGGATALPATPLGYVTVSIGGQLVKIPVYNP
jgi:hypothetical protein